MPRPTLFRVLLQQRHWDDWGVFDTRFQETARQVGAELGSAAVASATVPQRTFTRWFSGTWYGSPQRHAVPVLERMLGFPCTMLFRPAPDVLHVPAAVHERCGVDASARIGERWATSRVFLSLTASAADSWELCGRGSLDGTTIGVTFHPAVRDGTGRLRLRPADEDVLRGFVRPARRGVVVGVEERGDGELGLYAVDAVSARRTLAGPSGKDGAVVVPGAHELDDLTYGILWSLVQLDDGLLAHDRALAEEQRTVEAYLPLERSALSRGALPGVTGAAAGWMGSAFCARYIGRRLEGVSAAPVFWTREQTGEECAPWLFFAHKVDYLRGLGARYGGIVRVFVVPEEQVRRSPRYERVLLFLAVALMERLGITVRVVVDREFAGVDGFALVPGERVVVANWVRTDEVWAAWTMTERRELAAYRDTVGEATALDILKGGEGPVGRLRALAGLLGLEWGWLVGRCRDLGASGVAGMVVPRSRLITLAALEDTLDFVGALDPAR
ncbi:transcriptional regulator, XRE family protein [Streptomyces sp. NPDC020875]|uniref:transcriptional regulator, XRE family protein n=1 Tax=Streptomyces sp. NPDC020875 TaxID=3154898 RepID=UPI0033E6133A